MVVSFFTFLLYLLSGVVWLTLTEVGAALCMGSNPTYGIASETTAITLPLSFDNVSVGQL